MDLIRRVALWMDSERMASRAWSSHTQASATTPPLLAEGWWSWWSVEAVWVERVWRRAWGVIFPEAMGVWTSWCWTLSTMRSA